MFQTKLDSSDVFQTGFDMIVWVFAVVVSVMRCATGRLTPLALLVWAGFAAGSDSLEVADLAEHPLHAKTVETLQALSATRSTSSAADLHSDATADIDAPHLGLVPDNRASTVYTRRTSEDTNVDVNVKTTAQQVGGDDDVEPSSVLELGKLNRFRQRDGDSGAGQDSQSGGREPSLTHMWNDVRRGSRKT